MPTRAFWRGMRDWSGFVGAFGMVLVLTVAPYLFRDDPHADHVVLAQSAEIAAEAPAEPASLMAEAR